MNREQLERLGVAGLRRIAEQVGLRGARLSDREALVIGLAAYFEQRSSDEDEEEGEEDTAAVQIPPALTTETMARLLESQGQTTHASAVRARLAANDSDAPADGPAVTAERLAEGGVALSWSGARGGEPLLVIRSWSRDGTVREQEVSLVAPTGRRRFDPPRDAVRLCAAIGDRTTTGFRPLARSAVVAIDPKRGGAPWRGGAP